MKPSEAKILIPGTFLMAKGAFWPPTKIVVSAVQVKSARDVVVVSLAGLTYPAKDVDLPTPEVWAKWAEKDATEARTVALRKEMERVSQVLGTPAHLKCEGWGVTPTTYTVTLSQAAALALVARLEDQSC